MVQYSQELIDEIINANDIVDVISQYVQLKRRGRSFFGLCPFHKEKSPSFSVSPDKQLFNCFGCHTGGTVIHFISKIEHLNFREAVEFLAERANIALPVSNNTEDLQKQYLKDRMYAINEETATFYHENLYKPTAKLAQDYVKQRKLDNKTLKLFRIGCSGNYNELYNHLKSKGFKDEEIVATGLVNKNEKGQFIDRYRKRLMFPIVDIRGKVIAFGGRILEKNDKMAKYINSPENLIYSKRRNLFALNIAKNSDSKKIIMVEGYMDAISLHQRGINNVVASLGTALTEEQGRLLRKYSEQVIISYDSDGAGQDATMRGLEILKNLGCDVRILQMEDAKDPDEYVIKYGTGRFNLLVENAISLTEFKVKMLKQKYDLNNTNDKIKFLKEIAKLLVSVDNNIEKEIYIDKISKEYEISKEAIYADINKMKFSANMGEKVLERKPIPKVVSKEDNKINESIIKRENIVIYLLMNEPEKVYEKLSSKIGVKDFKNEINKIILEKIYNEFKNGNFNITAILSSFEDESIINRISEITLQDNEIEDIDKCIEDIINSYNKDSLINERNEILAKLEDRELPNEERIELEKRLNEIIVKLAKSKKEVY